MAVDVTPDPEQETDHSAAYVAFRAEQKARNKAYWQAYWEAKRAAQAQQASATIARDAHSGR